MSNRLTFSLASLIVLFAIGLVFMPTAAFAQTAITGVTVSSSPGAGYVAAQDIEITVTFENRVTLTATADTKLNFKIGTTAKAADWLSTEAAAAPWTVKFKYTVLAGEEGPVSIGANAIDLQNGAEINAFNAGDDPVSLGHAAPDIDGVYHNVDAVDPRITDAAFTNSGPYGLNDNIEVSLTFSEPVSVDAANRSNTELNLEVGTMTKKMSLKGSSTRTSTLMFSYTVSPGDTDEDGVALQILAMSPNVAYITDMAGNPLYQHVLVENGGIVDTTGPGYAATDPIKITSTGPYADGDEIAVTLAYNENVIVDKGAPQLIVRIGSSSQFARYVSGTGTQMLKFSYLVQLSDQGNADADVTIPAGNIVLGGSTIKDAAGNDAPIIHGAVAKAANQVVSAAPLSDTTPPTFTDDAPTAPIMTATVVTLSFSEPLSAPPTVTGSPTQAQAAYQIAVAAGTGNAYTVTVTPTLAASLTANVPQTPVVFTVTGSDAAGNPIAAGTTFTVTLDARTAPPTDTTPPTLTPPTVPTAPIMTATVVTLSFSEPLSAAPTVTGSPTQAQAAYQIAVAAGIGNAYTVTVTPTPAASLTADVPQTPVVFTVTGSDAAGNPIAAGTTFTVTLAERTVPLTGFRFKTNTLENAIIPLTAGTPISVGTGTSAVTYIQLPAATGGSGPAAYAYSLRIGSGREDVTNGHNGLSVDTGTLQLSGTPETADAVGSAGTTYYWTAIDTLATSSKPIEIPFTVTVAPATQVPPLPIPITIATKSAHLAPIRVLGSAAYTDVPPDQPYYEFTLSSAQDIRNGVSVSNASSSRIRPNVSPANSWTLQVWSNTWGNRSHEARIHALTGYQLQVVNPNDPASHVSIREVRVRLDREAPRINHIRLISSLPTAGGPFYVRITFNDLLKVVPTPADFTVVNGGISDIIPVGIGNMYGESVYSAKITPDAGVGPDNTDTKKRNVEIRLNAGLLDKYDNPSVATAADANPDGSFRILKASTAAPPPTPHGTITVSYDPLTMTATLSGTIPANPFASISRLNDNNSVNYPDLQRFFDIGGTIDLHDADATDGDDDNSREVVISEILWGLDRGAAGINRETQYQFIEFYNTTGAPVDVTGWTLVFSEGRPSDANIDVDQVSNRPPFGLGFDFDVGKSGRVTGTEAVDLTSAILPENIVSMYRNIAYATVEKPDHDADATENRKKQLAGVPDGNNKDSWKPSQRRDPNTPDVGILSTPPAATDTFIGGNQAARWIYASRNAQHHQTTKFLEATAVPSSPFRINEIGNDSGPDNDWVELHNVTDGEVSLKNYALSKVTAHGTDDKIFDFKDQDWKVPGYGFIVIATRHPQYTDLATGKDVSLADDLQDPKGLKHVYVVKSVDLPDNGKFTLILRSAHDKQKSKDNIIDVASSPEGAFSDVSIASKLWPLVGSGAPSGKVIKGELKNYAAGKVYQRDKGDGRGDENFSVAGYTGIGYDVKAEVASTNHGTPGYANDALKPNMAGLTDGVIKISEIMVDVGDSPRRKLPQWIELHNSSKTLGINLDGWKINIENAAEAGADPETNTFYASITLSAKTILPNQTVLVVSRTGDVRNPNHFPRTRVVNLWTTKAHREELEMTHSTDQVLSTRGFSIELVDKDGNSVDRVGNLDGRRHTRDNLETTWAIPMSDDPESRSSMLRVYDQQIALDGTIKEAWRLASDTILAFEVSHAYYGNADDVGTPGYRHGGPLPVSLSKFRPERLKDTGEVVVRWVTESELNNAGFNILRSEKRDGEFTKVHYQAGKGTTSERTVYEWKDTSAKPNVVYYYQIQDVSLDGDVTPLRITHLRGNVTAAGKATTTWGEIKALQ